MNRERERSVKGKQNKKKKTGSSDALLYHRRGNGGLFASSSSSSYSSSKSRRARARERERERERSHANERKEKQTNRTHFQLFQQFPDQIVRSRRALHRNLYRSQFAIVRRRRFVFRDFIRAADKPRDGARGRRHRPGGSSRFKSPCLC